MGSRCSEGGESPLSFPSASVRMATVTGGNGGLLHKNLEGGEPFSMIRGAVVLGWPGKLLLFFFILPPLSPGCKGNCTEHVAE